MGPLPATLLRGLAAAAVAVAALATAGEEPLKVLYAERAPYMSLAGTQVRGLTADVVRHALEKAGIPARWQEVPSARQLYLVQQNAEPLAAVGWYRTTERETFARFSLPLYQDRGIAVLARRDNLRVALSGSLDQLLGNRSLTLLAKVGYSYGAFLDERLARFRPAISWVTVENLNMMRMLMAGRADYMFASPEEAEAAILLSDLPANALSILELPGLPPGEKRYLMFSLKVDDETIQRLNRGIEDYQAQHRRSAR